MPSYIDIRSDFSEVNEYLGELGKQGKNISKYILRNIGRITKNKVKKSYNSYLHKDTGYLYKSIKSTQSKRSLYNVVSANARDPKTKVRYGYVQSAGATIKPKNKPYLTFQINGKWKKMKEVRVPAKNFMEEPANKYLKSTAIKQDIDKYLQKKLDQLEKQGKITIESVEE
jgi:hypothetical protein